jgi:type II secretory pathway pseudopilin PulG
MTLLELVVVCAIISVLLALIIPAVLQVREGARRIQCRNNLKQVGVAVHAYLDTFQVLPQSIGCADRPRSYSPESWSVHSHLLPYLDQTTAYRKLDFGKDWTDPGNQATGVPQQQIAVYSCPSDPNGSAVHFAGSEEGYVFPANYAFNFGHWMVFNPAGHCEGDGCFTRNGRIGAAQISDGLSNTLCAAEVKTYQPCIVNTRDPGPMPPHSTATATPAQYARGAELMLGPQRDDNDGHSEWCDGMVHQTGFTTAFTPNQFIPYTHTDGRTYDIDWSSQTEGTSDTRATYAAITARSYHAGIVHVLMMDGSVRHISQNIAAHTWRALSSRSCGEVIGEF